MYPGELGIGFLLIYALFCLKLSVVLFAFMYVLLKRIGFAQQLDSRWMKALLFVVSVLLVMAILGYLMPIRAKDYRNMVKPLFSFL